MAKKVKHKSHVEIKVDMRVSLEIRNENAADGMSSFVMLSSVIEEILDDGRLLIHMPLHHGYHYPLPRDNPFLMSFFEGTKMYALPVQFEERTQRDGLMFARVRRVGGIKSHQRRDCFRYPCSLPVVIERLNKNKQSADDEQQAAEGQMINFSDGGMLFATNEELEKGEKIALAFDIGRAETVTAVALRVESVTDGNFRYKVAVQFRIKDKDRAQKQRFYKYIVEMQSLERRRLTQDIKPLYPAKAERKDRALI